MQQHAPNLTVASQSGQNRVVSIISYMAAVETVPGNRLELHVCTLIHDYLEGVDDEEHAGI